MSDIDLMGLVQPTSGWFAIVGIGGPKDVRQELVATREEADETIARFLSQNRNVYFGLAKYKDGSSRSKENVQALKSFWMDIDCGPAKALVNEKTGRPDGYIDQEKGLEALGSFCSLIGLPEPTIVNSGRGWHVYWPLEEEVPRDQWELVSDRLRDLCVTHKFYADPACFEVARILRVPGTFNYKQDPPLPVFIESVGEYTTIEELRELLGVTEKPRRTEWDPSERQRAMARSTGYNFQKIMVRSAKGDGCNQLLHAYTNRHDLTYYEWFYALSVAARCDDAAVATHKLSEGHAEYDPETLDAKVATIRKATSCARFKATNPELCEGCPHLGRILGPKELGKVIREDSSKEAVIEDTSPQTGKPATYVIPKYPFPFIRREGGGILRLPPKNPKEGEETEPTLVYEHDLYVVKRMNDSVLGDMVVIRLHLPADGIREFVMAFYEATDKTALRKMLSMKGVVCTGNRFNLLMEYFSCSVATLQYIHKAEIMRQQFGWVDNHTKFVIGDQEISSKGVYYSPPSSNTQKLSKFIGPVGSFDKWKAVWDMYNEDGLEPHAFAALSTFGAPLLYFLNQTGAAINLYSPNSGTGKTTVLNMINSVWGHPSDLRLKESDTLNGKIQWLGILNNMPCTMDEVTNMKSEEFSDLLYALSNGKGKERMVAGSNELRENNTTWQTITTTTSNASFYEKLSVLKHSAEGELMRLIEYAVEPTTVINVERGKEMFDDVLFNNYGHAGPVYIEYIIGHMEEVRATCAEIQGRIDRELRLTPKERFWSATVAANIVGGLIAKRCGLIKWDMARIYTWASRRIALMREEVSAPIDSTDQAIGEFINRHIQNVLVVDDLVDKRTSMQSLPKREPKGELLIRIEPDTKRMFIAARAFREDCVRYQISYREVLRELRAAGRYLGASSKRMTKGTNIASLHTHALMFDLSDKEFIDVDNFIEKEPAGVGSRG